MFGRSLTLFRIFGFTVRVNVTWAFLAILVAWSLAAGVFPALYVGLPASAYWWMAILVVGGLFFSIVAHELAHSLVARRHGLEMKGITLFMFGGVAEMEREPPSPRAEFLMAIAGPAASVVIAGLFYLLAALVAAAGGGAAAAGALGYLGMLNLVLAIFNMLPAFPLDGGRALRAFLWYRSGDVRGATRRAAAVGGAFGFVLAALGIVSALTGNIAGGIWWILIGMFVRGAARASLQQLEMQLELADRPVAAFMTPQPVTVPPDISVRDLVEHHVYATHHEMFPVMRGGRLLGSAGVREIREVPREKWGLVAVGEIMSPVTEETCVAPATPATAALALMNRTGNSRLLVAEHGELAGVVTLKDILGRVQLRMALEG